MACSIVKHFNIINVEELFINRESIYGHLPPGGWAWGQHEIDALKELWKNKRFGVPWVATSSHSVETKRIVSRRVFKQLPGIQDIDNWLNRIENEETLREKSIFSGPIVFSCISIGTPDHPRLAAISQMRCHVNRSWQATLRQHFLHSMRHACSECNTDPSIIFN